jgi:hypothetical protein
MKPTRLVFLCSLALLLSPKSSPAELIPDPNPPRIRITDARIRELFAAGLTSSPTIRSLVARIERSDVVVYVQGDAPGAWGVAGRLTLLSVVGDTRYVVIRLAPLRSVVQQLAMMGHELQQAVEVAERPAIVDAESMYREYLRIGYVNGATGSGLGVDTKAAVETGRRIIDELRDAALVFPPALLS